MSVEAISQLPLRFAARSPGAALGAPHHHVQSVLACGIPADNVETVMKPLLSSWLEKRACVIVQSPAGTEPAGGTLSSTVRAGLSPADTLVWT